MTAHFADVNGVKLAYGVQGEGPPLVLVMGYRLNSAAWPVTFIEQLARRFTVITLDNRGTGLSDKPVEGYAIANLARDVCAVLDQLGIAEANILGYSMGGAIAQEFVRQFPERVSSLILCATMPGGPRAAYAKATVLRVMRDLDGLSPEQVARRIWNVTYAPGFLEQHRALAEDQMRREIALPTPLHAADLQFQAFAEFDGSNALAAIRCPIMLLTGDLDELIPPQNSVLMAKLVPGAKLIVIPGAGHRVLWEATQVCVDLIIAFLNFDSDGSILVQRDVVQRQMPAAPHPMMSAIELFTTWPLIFAETGFEAMAIARQALMSASRFGDGKPIILVPGFLGSDLALLPLSLWLEALGYRPVMADLFINLEGSHAENSLSRAIREATQRLGRKAVLITHSSVITGALRTAVAHRELISDVVIFEARHGPNVAGVRTHYLSSRWSFVHGIIELPRLLRNIGIELLEGSTSEISGVATRSIDQTIAKEERK